MDENINNQEEIISASEIEVVGANDAHTDEEKEALVEYLDTYNFIAPYNTEIIRHLVDDLDNYSEDNTRPYEHLVWHIPAGEAFNMPTGSRPGYVSRKDVIKHVQEYLGIEE